MVKNRKRAHGMELGLSSRECREIRMLRRSMVKRLRKHYNEWKSQEIAGFISGRLYFYIADDKRGEEEDDGEE